MESDGDKVLDALGRLRLARPAHDHVGLVAWPIRLTEHLIEPRVALFNALAATLQILIGLGLLYRPTVRIALLGSVGWALSVWWIGEGLGGLFTGSASPLTGAPGAALLYVFSSLILWPRPVGGLLGRRGALVAWTILWLGSAALWLLPVNRAADAVHNQIADAPSGTGWLSSIESSVANAASGHGLAIAIVAAALSVAVGLASLNDRSAGLSLILAVLLGVGYFVVGQGLGGIFTGSGTDPGTGPLLVLLALAFYAIRRRDEVVRGIRSVTDAGPEPPKVSECENESWVRSGDAFDRAKET